MNFTAENAKDAEKRENQISGIVLDAAIAVHTALGPGLLESAYQACLCYELSSRGVEDPDAGSPSDQVSRSPHRCSLSICLWKTSSAWNQKAVERLLPIHGRTATFLSET